MKPALFALVEFIVLRGLPTFPSPDTCTVCKDAVLFILVRVHVWVPIPFFTEPSNAPTSLTLCRALARYLISPYCLTAPCIFP